MTDENQNWMAFNGLGTHRGMFCFYKVIGERQAKEGEWCKVLTNGGTYRGIKAPHDSVKVYQIVVPTHYAVPSADRVKGKSISARNLAALEVKGGVR